MRRSNRSFPFFARNWISKELPKRPGRTCGSASVKSWLAVAASALPIGNAPARAQKCGIEMPAGHFNVRNLSESHARHARIPVNGNLFGNISTHRRYPTARDPYFA